MYNSRWNRSFAVSNIKGYLDKGSERPSSTAKAIYVNDKMAHTLGKKEKFTWKYIPIRINKCKKKITHKYLTIRITECKNQNQPHSQTTKVGGNFTNGQKI